MECEDNPKPTGESQLNGLDSLVDLRVLQTLSNLIRPLRCKGNSGSHEEDAIHAVDYRAKHSRSHGELSDAGEQGIQLQSERSEIGLQHDKPTEEEVQ